MEIDTVPEANSADVVFRPIHCKLNTHTRTDGSALLTQGDTAVTASIIGPTEAKLHNLQIEKANVEVYYRTKSGVPNQEEKRCELTIRNTCKAILLTVLYPRSSIIVQIHEMSNAGGLVACAVNAVCLALLHSGLSMKSLVAAVHCAINESNELVLDPEQDVCDRSVANCTFVFDNVDKNVIAVHTNGRFTIEQYQNALQQCKQASDVIFQLYRDAIRKFSKQH